METGLIDRPRVTEIDKAVDWLKENVPRHRDPKTKSSYNDQYTSTSYCIVTPNHLETNFRTYCHSGIGGKLQGIVCVGTEIALQRRLDAYNDDEAVFLPFLDFVLTDGLWAEYVVSDKDFARSTGIVVSSEAPQNVLQGLMITSRLFWEASLDSFLLFNSCLEKGLHRRVAFILAFHMNYSVRDYSHSGMYPKPNGHNRASYIDIPVEGHSGHRPFQLLGPKGLKKYVSGVFVPSRPYKDFQNTRGVSEMFNYEGESSLIPELFKDETFKAMLSEFRKGKVSGELYRPPNPFSKASPQMSPNQLSFEEYSEVVPNFLLKFKEFQA